MLLSSSRLVPRGAGWSYELKWDGYRGLASVADGRFGLRSRHGTDMTGWFPELGALAGHLGRDVVLDGEVVVLDAAGCPDFSALRRSGTRATFVAFDVLRVGGRETVGLALRERRAILAEVVRDALPLVVVSRPFTDGVALLAHAEALRLEGIVAKRDDRPYRPGTRAPDWVKVKTTSGRAEALRRASRRSPTRAGRLAAAADAMSALVGYCGA